MNPFARLFGRRRRERELDEEIAAHLRMAGEEQTAGGASAEDAARSAAREFGNVGLVKEVTREQWGWSTLAEILRDARYGLRLLRRSPGFTAVAVAVLALGIGANTAIFSVVNGVLLRPLPFPDSERILSLRPLVTRPVRSPAAASYPDFFDWRAQSRSFTAMASRRGVGMTLTGVTPSAYVRGQVVSSEFFLVLGVAPALGRGFVPGDDAPGTRVVVLSHGLWQSRFGGDPGILGRAIGLDGHDYTVVGVAAAGFQFPVDEDGVEFWMSASMDAEGEKPWTSNRDLTALDVIGRLKPGVSLAAARAEMIGIAKRLARQYPDTDRDRDEVLVIPELDRVVGDVRTPLLVLLGAVGCVLLIACANVANLLLARATARHRELALRTALGAGRRRVLRQLLTESLILALVGGAAGLLLALAGQRLLLQFSPGRIPRLEHAGLDPRILVFTLGVALVTGILFGIAPALRLSRTDLSQALKEGGRGSEGGAGHNRFRSMLVIAETAIAVVLLTGAGLLVESFRKLQSVDPGFSARDVATFHTSLPEAKYDEARQVRFYDDLLDRVRSREGVRSAAAIFPIPLGDSHIGITFTIEGRPVPKADEPSAQYRQVSPGYFQTMGIPLLSGRDFTDRDDTKAPPVIIVNEALVRTYFPGENVLGRRIRPGVARDGEPKTREIVGVVGNVRHRGLGVEESPEYYIPYRQLSIADMTVVAQTDADPRVLANDARAIVASLDPDVPVFRVQTLRDYVFASIAQPRFNALLLSLFAGVALVLTGIGLYGVLAYAVAVRTREIVIRMALGARRGDILAMVVRRGLVLAATGVVIGLAAALLVTRLLRALLFHVAPSDPATFAGAGLLLGAVALLASFVPAYRATRFEPMQALRGE